MLTLIDEDKNVSEDNEIHRKYGMITIIAITILRLEKKKVSV